MKCFPNLDMGNAITSTFFSTFSATLSNKYIIVISTVISILGTTVTMLGILLVLKEYIWNLECSVVKPMWNGESKLIGWSLVEVKQMKIVFSIIIIIILVILQLGIFFVKIYLEPRMKFLPQFGYGNSTSTSSFMGKV